MKCNVARETLPVLTNGAWTNWNTGMLYNVQIFKHQTIAVTETIYLVIYFIGLYKYCEQWDIDSFDPRCMTWKKEYLYINTVVLL